jgi:hypothetical protein
MKLTLRLAMLVVALAIAMPAASAFANPDLIKRTPLFEGHGAGTHIGTRRLFAWTNEMGRGRLVAFAETSGGALSRMSARRSNAYVGGFEAGTDRVVFQQILRGNSDLFVYDIGQRRRRALKDLNDGKWQWNPSIDTHRGVTWLTYGENRFDGPWARWRLFLVNMRTGERTVLDETSNRCGCLFPGTIAYPWVTWSIGADATTWRYDIRTGEREPMLPTDRDEYSAATTPNGTTYIAQAGDRCGVNAEIYRVDPGGITTLLFRLRDGREAANLSVDPTGAHDRLYFDRRVCRTGTADILRLRRAEVLHGIGGPSRRAPGPSGRRGFRRSAATPDASPRTR